jgi:hyaluronoglucosaminidase
MTVELGIIEGYYGTPWSFAAREQVIATLKPHGYKHFIYAPKMDPFLRKRWRESHPADTAAALAQLSAFCRGNGVRFGVGLSPFELYRDFNDEAKADLARKLAAFDTWGIDDLAILFDDMRGDLPDLAQTQVDILHWVKARTKATRLITCPSYYTDDPTLDRFFGIRPPNYLEDLGRLLDKSVEIFWTGEEVCSREYSPGHLARVSQQIGRKPFLWDNYPVNDGQRMSQYLHIRAFTGRPARIGEHLSAHSVNPALQPVLSCIPALSLAESYARGDAYEYGAAFDRAARAVAGDDLATALKRDLLFFQDVSRPRLQPQTIARLKERYGRFDHPAAREVLGFLDGAYEFQEEIA